MATSFAVKLPSYRKLRQQHHGDDDDGFADDGYYDFEKERVVVAKPRSSSSSSMISWYRLKSKLVPSVSLRRRRFRLRRRVVRLSRLLLLRRKIKLAYSHLRVSYRKVVKRFKDGQSHLGDLFAGNYMFLQVTPSSLKCRSYLTGAGGDEQKQHYLHHHQLQLQSFPNSRSTGMGYTFPRNN